MTWTKPGEPSMYGNPLIITPKGDDVRITADFRMANKGASRARIVPGVYEYMNCQQLSEIAECFPN